MDTSSCTRPRRCAGGRGARGVVTCDMPCERMAPRLAKERCAALSEKRSSTMTLKNRAYATSEESPSTARPFIHSVALEFRLGAGCERNHTLRRALYDSSTTADRRLSLHGGCGVRCTHHGLRAPAAGRAAAEGALRLEARTFPQHITERIVEARAVQHVRTAMRRVLWAAHRNRVSRRCGVRAYRCTSTPTLLTVWVLRAEGYSG